MIADRAENFVNQRNARAEAVFRLVGRARWCVVDREDMHFIENASDRMRVSPGNVFLLSTPFSLSGLMIVWHRVSK